MNLNTHKTVTYALCIHVHTYVHVGLTKSDSYKEFQLLSVVEVLHSHE